MGKAPQRGPRHPSTAVLPALQREKCILHELYHDLQSMLRHPIVTAAEGDFGELQTEGYQTSLPEACITNILDWSGLNPCYLTQTQPGHCIFFVLPHLGYKPHWKTPSTYKWQPPEWPGKCLLHVGFGRSALLLHPHYLWTVCASEVQEAEAQDSLCCWHPAYAGTFTCTQGQARGLLMKLT